MPVTGEGRRGILVVAEAPGSDEDEQNVQLIGKAGQLLRKHLRKVDIDLDVDCWKTNAVICRPPDNEVEDKHIECCRPTLLKTVRELQPDVILLLGASAVQSLIGSVWTGDVKKIGTWVGWKIPSQQFNAWLCPTWHPSYLARKDDPVLDLWFDRHLKAAVELEGKPWPDGPPDYRKDIDLQYTLDPAASVAWFYCNSKVVSFDYETDRLKPDHPQARIVSCSVSDGDYTVAFPWVGDVIEIMGRLLKGPVKKIGWSIKFEERWTRKEFGHGVRNWVWDGMQAAHILDNRKGITSLKFQAFVRCGFGPYDSLVSPYLKAGGGNEPNKIGEVELGEFLLYNGLDSLLTYKIAQQQRREME